MSEPWSLDKVAAVLTAACYQHFADRTSNVVTLSSAGEDERFEILEPDDADDDHELRLKRLPDGPVFEVEIWVAAVDVSPA